MGLPAFFTTPGIPRSWHISSIRIAQLRFYYRETPVFPQPELNLKAAVGRKKDAKDIGVHGEIKKFVATLWVMNQFFIVRGAPRACVDFCDPTAVSRLKGQIHSISPFPNS